MGSFYAQESIAYCVQIVQSAHLSLCAVNQAIYTCIVTVSLSSFSSIHFLNGFWQMKIKE